MTLLQLRTTLTTALAGLLGTYVDPNGGSHDAVVVGPKTPPGFSVQGLEVVIQRTPRVDERVSEFGSLGALNRYWEVTLKQWDPNQGLDDSIRAVLAALPTALEPTIVGPTDQLIETATLRVEFSEGL